MGKVVSLLMVPIEPILQLIVSIIQMVLALRRR